MVAADIVQLLRESSANQRKYEQGEGCADLLDAAADAIEQLRLDVEDAAQREN
jgi:hypothetical protein